MAVKQFPLHANLTVSVYKRRRNRSLRLTVTPKGEIKVSIPAWAAYQTGVQFAKARRDWIQAQLDCLPESTRINGQSIGKAHHLRLQAAEVIKPQSRVHESVVLVTYPASLSPHAPAVQAVAERASLRALKRQAESLLPQRLQQLAEQHGYQYRSVRIKQLKSRWGSCDQNQNITLNLFLMQLPWRSIDYVLLHELAHTKVLKHGPEFWAELERVLPDARQQRRALYHHHPVLS